MITAFLLSLLELISSFEGLSNRRYVDPGGVQTICYGHTATASFAQFYSSEVCTGLLISDAVHALSVVESSVLTPIPPDAKMALASFVYNVGQGAFLRSTLLRRLNNGDGASACSELDRWVYADGKRLRGLVRRRAAERALCEAAFD